MKQCSPVDSPSTGKKISFAGRSAVAGKSEKKTQRRIYSSRFFIPPPMTVKEETSDGLTSTTEQTPTTRLQEETKLILSPTLTTDYRRSMTNQTPNQDWQILGFLYTSRGPFASQETVWKVEELSSEASRLHGSIAGGGCITLKTEDKVICHACTRAHIKHQLTGHVNARRSLHHQRLYKLEGCHAKEGCVTGKL